MKQRRLTVRGAVPLVLCVSAAARVPLAGRAAFIHGSAMWSTPSTLASSAQKAEVIVAGTRLCARLSSGLRTCVTTRRNRAALHTGLGAAGGDGSTANDEDLNDLDERVNAAVAALPRRPRCAVVGGGFAGLATAYHLAAFGSDVTVFDPNEVGTGGASAVAAGLLHPLTPRGKVIWKGEEGFRAAKEMLETANAGLSSLAGGESTEQTKRDCLTTGKVYRPLMDEKQYDTFAKAAEDLPQWVQRLTREEYLEAVPGSDTKCLGGVCIRGALALDAPSYLKGLWAACRGAVTPNGKSGGGGGATWVHERVENVHTLEASGDFDAVVACVGAGVQMLAGVKDIVSLRLVRGQSLLYDNVNPAVATSKESGGSGTGDSGEEKKERILTSAVLCGQYVVPTAVGGPTGNGGRLLCGSTQEPVLWGEKVDKPANMEKALRQLEPKIAKFFPALQGVEPIGVTSGVRVIQDRNSYGRIPVAGRLPFSKRGWVIAALGARGLIHHAYLGKLVAACALLDSDDSLPPQVMAPLEDLGKDSTGDL